MFGGPQLLLKRGRYCFSTFKPKHSVHSSESSPKSLPEWKTPGTLLPDILLRIKNNEAGRDTEGESFRNLVSLLLI